LIDGPIDARNKGISVIYQEVSLINPITVGENIYLGNEREMINHGLYNRRQLYEKCSEYLRKFDLDIDPRQKVSELRMGQKRIIEIIKALTLNANILLLDEPTSGMSKREIDALFLILEELRKNGVTMIYISHYLEEVFRICNKATVFRDGEYIQTFDVSKIDQETLVKAMIGYELKQKPLHKTRDLSNKDLTLELVNFKTELMKAPVSLKAHEGEIVGILNSRIFIPRIMNNYL